MATLSTLQQRYQDLVGQSTATINAFGTRNINAFIQDVINRYKFSWDLTTDDLTLSSGTATLPSDYNPLWRLEDARIVVSSDQDDNVFTEVTIEDRDNYVSGDYVYWITFDTTTNTHIFNSKTLTGTVKIYYYFKPTDLSGASDVCIVPDAECVAYGAAAKRWIGEERNTELKREYETIANNLVQAMYFRDLAMSPSVAVGSISDQLLAEV